MTIPIEFSDAAQVKQVMDQIAVDFAAKNAGVQTGALASFATAISTLAKEVEALKEQARSS